MGHRIYTTKKVLVGGTIIEVRQPVFKGRDGVATLVQKVLTEARQLVEETLRLANPSGFVKDIRSGSYKGKMPPGLFQKLFMAPPDHANLSTVWANLARISHGLSGPFGLKIYTQTDGTLGYVNKYYPLSRMIRHTSSTGDTRSRISLGHIKVGRCARVDGAVLRTADYGSALIGKGEIHVSFENLNSPTGALTLIHEAGHKFANLADFSYMYDFVYEDAITPAETLLNADSYAWLCFVAPSAAKDTAQRRENQAANASNDGLDGVGALFG